MAQGQAENTRIFLLAEVRDVMDSNAADWARGSILPRANI